MAKRNKVFNLVFLSSMMSMMLTSCQLDKPAIVEIAEIDLTGVTFEDASFNYDGYPHSIFAKNVPDDVSVTYENNGVTQVGTHKVIARFNKQNYGSSSLKYKEVVKIATIEIVKAGSALPSDVAEKINSLQFPSEENLTFNYTGESYTASLANPENVPSGFIAVYSNNSHSNAGTYSVSCEIMSKETMVSYRTVRGKMTIKPQEIDIKDVVFEDENYSLDGSVHILEAKNVPENVTVEYSCEDFTDIEGIQLPNWESKKNDPLPNALIGEGKKKVKARFIIDPSSGLMRNNYKIVNTADANNSTYKVAYLSVYPAKTKQYTIKYLMENLKSERYGEIVDGVQKVDRVYASESEYRVYAERSINIAEGSYLDKNKLLQLDGYETSVLTSGYEDILSDKGHLFETLEDGVTIQIKFKPKEYNVIFSVDNGEIERRTYVIEEKISELRTPRLTDGYRFMGWYTDKEFTSPIANLNGLFGDRIVYGRTVVDQKINTFVIKDTFKDYNGSSSFQGYSIDTFGSAPTDVKVVEKYYLIKDDGTLQPINNVDENLRPKEVGKYLCRVHFYSLDNDGNLIYTEDEAGNRTYVERYQPLQAVLVINKNEISSDGVIFNSTSFERKDDPTFGDYPTITNYPSNASLKRYEFYSSSMKYLCSYDPLTMTYSGEKPVETGNYFIKAILTYSVGSDSSGVINEDREFISSFTITKKTYSNAILNAINDNFASQTYTVNGTTVSMTSSNNKGNFQDKNISDVTQYSSSSDLLELRLSRNFDNGLFFLQTEYPELIESVTALPDGKDKIVFKAGLSYPNLIVSYITNSIKKDQVGKIQATMQFGFENEEDALNWNLPSIKNADLTVMTSGYSDVVFKDEKGNVIRSLKVKPFDSVVAPDPYTTNPATITPDYEYYWESSNQFSTVDKILGDTIFTLKRREKTFKISFVVDENSKGSFSEIEDKTFTISSTQSFSDIDVQYLTHLGYTFDRFYYYEKSDTEHLNPLSISLSDLFTTIGKRYDVTTNYLDDIVIYISTSPNQTKAVFDAAGGTISGSSEINQTFGKKFVLANSPTKAGAKFVGWRYNGQMVSENSIYSTYQSGTLNFVAVYTTNTKSVTFLPENGGDYISYEVLNQQEIPYPTTDPVKYGYRFEGWYTSEGTKFIKGSIMVGDDSLIYLARYTPLSIRIDYHSNPVDESENDSIFRSISVLYSSVAPDSSNYFEPPSLKDGCTFLGWSFDGKEVNNTSTLISSYHVVKDGENTYYVLDAYPVYQNNNYTITYDYQIPSMLNKSVQVIYGQQMTLEYAPTKIGYIFEGWRIKDAPLSDKLFNEILQENDNRYPYSYNLSLVASWKKKTYTVYFTNSQDPTASQVGPFTISYGDLLSVDNNTWPSLDQITDELKISKAVSAIFNYNNGEIVSENSAFLFDNSEYSEDDDNSKLVYIDVGSTVSNFFTITYVADQYSLPSLQTVSGADYFNLLQGPMRDGKRFVAYFYYYKDQADGITKKYYLTETGLKDGKPLTKWAINQDTAKNGITDYVLYCEFEPLEYRLFFKTNDQQDIFGDGTFVVTKYGEEYNITSNQLNTDRGYDSFNEAINAVLVSQGYSFNYWIDTYGRIISASTILTDPRCIDISNSPTDLNIGIYLYAQVTPLKYTITYISDNSTNPYVLNVSYNQPYSKLTSPSKVGFKFIRWRYFPASVFTMDKYRNNDPVLMAAEIDGSTPEKTMNEVTFTQRENIIAMAFYEGDQYKIIYEIKGLSLTSSTGYKINSPTEKLFTTAADDLNYLQYVKYKEQSYSLLNFSGADSIIESIQDADKKKQILNYLKFYKFVGWRNKATQVIYQPGQEFKEYLDSYDSTYEAVYEAKNFVINFQYDVLTFLDNNSLSNPITKTIIADKIRLVFGDSFTAPTDPIPGSNSIYAANKKWLSNSADITDVTGREQTNNLITCGDPVKLDFSFLYSKYFRVDPNKPDALNNFLLSLDDPIYDEEEVQLTFSLESLEDDIGYYRIILNNNQSCSFLATTEYPLINDGTPLEDQKLSGNQIKPGNRIILPNINKVLTEGGNLNIYNDITKATSVTSLADQKFCDINVSSLYKYRLNGIDFTPYMRTVYVINGEYYLDGDYSPISVSTSVGSGKPTEFYAFTTYVAGYNSSTSLSELFNFTLTDADGNPINSHIASATAPEESESTLEIKNEIALAGFMNKEWTRNCKTNESVQYMLLPYFYYDGIKVRKVSAIVKDQLGVGAFEDCRYVQGKTNGGFFIPSTITYIEDTSFKNAIELTTEGSTQVNQNRLFYLDSASYSDNSLAMEDTDVRKNKSLYAINSNKFSYEGRDTEATFISHTFFAGRKYNCNNITTDIAKVNLFTPTSYVNDFGNLAVGSFDPNAMLNKLNGSLFYYSNTNSNRIPFYFEPISRALEKANNNENHQNRIIAVPQTKTSYGDDDDYTNNDIGYFSETNSYITYNLPFYLFNGSSVNFAMKYSTKTAVNSLKIEDSEFSGMSYKDSPYMKIDKYFLTLPLNGKDGSYNYSYASTIDPVKMQGDQNLKDSWDIIYLSTIDEISAKVLQGSTYNQVNQSDSTYFDDITGYGKNGSHSFISLYKEYGDNERDPATLDYLFSDFDQNYTGAEYFFKVMTENYAGAKEDVSKRFNKLCYDFLYSDSKIDNNNTELTKMIAVKNNKLNRCEYFYLGTYEEFLSTGKENVDKYSGRVINCLDFSQLAENEIPTEQQRKEDPLCIFDDSIKDKLSLKTIFLGSSSKYLSSLTDNAFKQELMNGNALKQVTDRNLMYCTTSDIDYNTVPLYFGTMNEYMLASNTSGYESKYPKSDGTFVVVLQTNNVNATILQRMSVNYLYHKGVNGTVTDLVDYSVYQYLFNTAGEFINPYVATGATKSNLFYSLYSSNQDITICQIKEGTTSLQRNLTSTIQSGVAPYSSNYMFYYTGTSKKYAELGNHTTNPNEIVVTVRQDVTNKNWGLASDRTALQVGDLEIFVTNNAFSTNSYANIKRTISGSDSIFSKVFLYVAQPLSSLPGSSIQFFTNESDFRTIVTSKNSGVKNNNNNNNDGSVISGNGFDDSSDKIFLFDYFFNSYVGDATKIIYQNLVKVDNGIRPEYYFNENIKTLLTQFDSLNIGEEIKIILRDNIFKALYCKEAFKGDSVDNMISTVDFEYTFLDTSSSLINKYNNLLKDVVDITTDTSYLNSNLNVGNSFIFVKPTENYKDVCDPNVLVDDMEITFSLDQKLLNLSDSYKADLTNDISSNVTYRYYNIIGKDRLVKALAYEPKTKSVEMILYTPYTEKDACNAIYALELNGDNYVFKNQNKFILVDSITYTSESTKSDLDDVYNFIGTKEDLLSLKNNSQFKFNNLYYTLKDNRFLKESFSYSEIKREAVFTSNAISFEQNFNNKYGKIEMQGQIDSNSVDLSVSLDNMFVLMVSPDLLTEKSAYDKYSNQSVTLIDYVRRILIMTGDNGPIYFSDEEMQKYLLGKSILTIGSSSKIFIESGLEEYNTIGKVNGYTSTILFKGDNSKSISLFDTATYPDRSKITKFAGIPYSLTGSSTASYSHQIVSDSDMIFSAYKGYDFLSDSLPTEQKANHTDTRSYSSRIIYAGSPKDFVSTRDVHYLSKNEYDTKINGCVDRVIFPDNGAYVYNFIEDGGQYVRTFGAFDENFTVPNYLRSNASAISVYSYLFNQENSFGGLFPTFAANHLKSLGVTFTFIFGDNNDGKDVRATKMDGNTYKPNSWKVGGANYGSNPSKAEDTGIIDDGSNGQHDITNVLYIGEKAYAMQNNFFETRAADYSDPGDIANYVEDAFSLKRQNNGLTNLISDAVSEEALVYVHSKNGFKVDGGKYSVFAYYFNKSLDEINYLTNDLITPSYQYPELEKVITLNAMTLQAKDKDGSTSLMYNGNIQLGKYDNYTLPLVQLAICNDSLTEKVKVQIDGVETEVEQTTNIHPIIDLFMMDLRTQTIDSVTYYRMPIALTLYNSFSNIYLISKGSFGGIIDGNFPDVITNTTKYGYTFSGSPTPNTNIRYLSSNQNARNNIQTWINGNTAVTKYTPIYTPLVMADASTNIKVFNSSIVDDNPVLTEINSLNRSIVVRNDRFNSNNEYVNSNYWDDFYCSYTGLYFKPDADVAFADKYTYSNVFIGGTNRLDINLSNIFDVANGYFSESRFVDTNGNHPFSLIRYKGPFVTQETVDGYDVNKLRFYLTKIDKITS